MTIHRSEVINRIISKYSMTNPEYLEIGVWTGDTFKHINSRNKDGVDPGQYCECSFVNYKMTSDEFFFTHCKKKYDIIFIDGLHTAYQVSKDIKNSISFLNGGGFIILDDVYPHCEYEQEALNLRKSGPQAGDVWKSVYNILDDLIAMSEKMYFVENTERGSLIFKIKSGNCSNIKIDESIPTCNLDGWYTGNSEWNKYLYGKDFHVYLNKIRSFEKLL